MPDLFGETSWERAIRDVQRSYELQQRLDVELRRVLDSQSSALARMDELLRLHRQPVELGLAEALRSTFIPVEFTRLNQAIETFVQPLRSLSENIAFAVQGFGRRLEFALDPALESIRTIGAVLGEYQLDIDALSASLHGPAEAESQAKSDQGSREDEPEAEITRRLVSVRFVPVQLFEEIRKNPALMHGLDPIEFERFVADILGRLGFEEVAVTPRSGDGGRDITAVARVSDIPVMFAFECKRHAPNKKVQVEELRSLLGSIVHHPTGAQKGVLVTTSSFTRDAKRFLVAESRIDGKDFDGLVRWISQCHPRT